MRTTATKVDGGWILNGAKRWIGNATFSDYVAVYARDPEDEQVKGFIVDTAAEGYTATLMENRIAIRAVQNADIALDNVFVPDSDKLEGANSFKDLNKVLKSARSTVGWQAVGTQMGALDVALGYADERVQFGKKISSFQLNQNKLATMQGNLVASESMMGQPHAWKTAAPPTTSNPRWPRRSPRSSCAKRWRLAARSWAATA